MKLVVQKPQMFNAFPWDGTTPGAQEIMDYILSRKNSTAVFRNSISAVRKILRMHVGGRVLDMYPGQVLLHNLSTDEITVVPGDYYQENFRTANRSETV